MIQTQIRARKADHEIDPIYLERWSPRSFSEEEIPEEVLLSVLEAARWAPSAFNLQPWRFIVARTEAERKSFYPFISEFNRSWCEKAPILLLILAKKDEKHEDLSTHIFDAGAAWGFLALEATRKGLITHPMTGFDFELARKTLDVPEEYEIQALIAMGYQGPKEALPKGLQQRERPSERRPIKEFIHYGKFHSNLE